MQHDHSPSNSSREKKPISMHEDVPIWADCCSCEAEPYWQALAEEQEKDEQGNKTVEQSQSLNGKEPPER